MGYLKARGYWSTIDEITKVGTWREVRKGDLSLRELQWDGFQGPFKEGQQCDVLGFPVDYYESH
jgi:hypothetical protein